MTKNLIYLGEDNATTINVKAKIKLPFVISEQGHQMSYTDAPLILFDPTAINEYNSYTFFGTSAPPKLPPETQLTATFDNFETLWCSMQDKSGKTLFGGTILARDFPTTTIKHKKITCKDTLLTTTTNTTDQGYKNYEVIGIFDWEKSHKCLQSNLPAGKNTSYESGAIIVIDRNFQKVCFIYQNTPERLPTVSETVSVRDGTTMSYGNAESLTVKNANANPLSCGFYTATPTCFFC